MNFHVEIIDLIYLNEIVDVQATALPLEQTLPATRQVREARLCLGPQKC